VLTESGEVYPCELLAESLGNVRAYDYDVRKILRSEKAGTAVRTIRDQRCYCTHECNYITNILFNPGMYPALAREYLRL
jgi:MoaA/NifB/PqqE/SkfB family radical SAM enzyme